ncbi:MAG: TonB-dependent receptor domain-containing protein [Bryobacteraceae bacterium]
MPRGKSLAQVVYGLVIGLAFLAAPLRSQTFYGSIVGNVNDASGATMAGVTVTLTNNGTGDRRTVTTGSDGSYRLVNLVPGNYKVDIEQAGFKRYTRDKIEVNVDAAVRVDVRMELGEVTQSVEVLGTAPLLQTESGSLSQIVAARSVEELPLNGRNVLNLVQLVPGVVPQGSSEGSLTGKNVFAGGNYQIGGGTANQSASYYDGVPVNDPYGNIVALIPSQDAVSEFRVQTNANSAEYGRYTGGVVNLASKSGTNEFHGSAYEFLRNRALNAGTFFANKTGAGKPGFTQNQFGVSIGGPVIKDKIFFFGGYEGYRQRQAVLFLNTVPTELMTAGDFSDYRNASGALIPIYDPLTQCGAYGNPACGTATDQRSVFPGNKIPVNRFNPVMKKFVDFPIYAKPTFGGDAYTHNFNFSKNATVGGDNDQGNFRGDFNISDKQRLLMRYTRWKSVNLPVDVYGNGQRAGDPYSPEAFITDHAVVADTYSLSPTSILDVRLGFMRWFYSRIPGNLGISASKTFGLPTYFDNIPTLNGVTPGTTIPGIGASGYNTIATGLLFAADNTYVITPSLIKIMGRHTWKFGAELRRADVNYYQNNSPSGSFSFSNIFTSRNALNSGATGNSFASLLLGYASAGSVQTSPFTAGSSRYQAYYANDTWNATSKLTLNLGVRWDIPGVYTERFDRLATWNGSLPNPLLSGITIDGKPVLGRFVLVNTPEQPERGLRPEKFNLFAPRVGIAYRLSGSTVVRAGAGLYYIPSTLSHAESPYGNPANYLLHEMVNSIDSMVTPADTMSNPIPAGLFPAPGRDPSYQSALLGGTGRTITRDIDWGYSEQWNFTLQHQLPGNIAVEAAYAALRGIHLPFYDYQRNQLDPKYFSMGAALKTQVPNPFYGLVKTGTLKAATVQRGQLLLPYPQLQTARDITYIGVSDYHALQVKAEKRFESGGTLLASYTFSKMTGNVESITTWLDSSLGGTAVIQDAYNLAAESALSSYDSRQRLTVSYVVDLPIGRGKRLLPDVKGVAGKLISGWGVNGLSTFQMGFPLLLTASPNNTGFNTGLRPNVVPGCQKSISGSAQSRLMKWFNTSCFTVPSIYTMGDESRTDPELRGHGINNFNFALFKRTSITERFNLEYRAEFFNLFNRVQFGRPNQVASTAANNTFGQVTTQINDPRLIQMALRLRF